MADLREVAELVCRLANNSDVAGGQLAVFKAPAKRPYLPTAHFDRNDITIICETVH